MLTNSQQSLNSSFTDETDNGLASRAVGRQNRQMAVNVRLPSRWGNHKIGELLKIYKSLGESSDVVTLY